MNTEELVQDNNVDIGICDECSGEIHCNKENVYILTKDEENDKLWCQCCFEELWKEYSNNGWTGDDIEYYLELEKEEEEDKSLCKNQDCSPIHDTKFTEKCSICSGYFEDNGVNDIYFLSENGGVGSCNLCKKTQNVCIMKGTGQYVCVNACDEEEDDEETS